MQGPLLSVIIPVYNGERYLAESIQSVLAQDYRPIEIIVVDDGSTDGTAEIARFYKNIRYLFQKNKGLSGARNTGIAAAQGEFLAFLDADDMWMPEKLSRQVSYLAQHPDVGFVYAHRRMIIEEGVKTPSWYIEHDSPGLIPSTLVARKNIFETVGYYNPDYKFAENAEWLARARDAGIPMAVLPETLLIYRVHDRNLTHHLDEMRHDVLRALKSSIDRQRSKGQTKKSTSLDEEQG
ncbi:MAG TPA: glycosyltransferase [Thermodesulfobacteriota bacterium]|nr:glycosyltransferase [Thermodesulfobacteriota bacterium]